MTDYYLAAYFIIGLILGGATTSYFYRREHKKLKEGFFDLFRRMQLPNKKILTTPVYDKRVRKIFKELRPRLVNDKQEDISND